MAIHDIVATTYYLENYDRSKINLEVISTENVKLEYLLQDGLNNCNDDLKLWSSSWLFMILGLHWKAT